VSTAFSSASAPAASPPARRLAAAAALLALPLAGLFLLLARPALDVQSENHPSHFWLVLAAGGLHAVLAYGTGVAARRRRDARVFLVSFAFLAAAAFLGLHGLAAPGVCARSRTPASRSRRRWGCSSPQPSRPR